MTDPQSELLRGNSTTESDERTEKLNEETVSAHYDDTRYVPHHPQLSEEYWKNAANSTESSDDDLPLARRSTRHRAAAPMVDPNMTRTPGTEPQRQRHRVPPPWENSHVYIDADASLANPTTPVRRTRHHPPPSHGPIRFNIYQDEALPETDEEIARRLQEQFKREAGLGGTGSYNVHHPAQAAPDAQSQWGRLAVHRESDVDRMQGHYAPAGMHNIHTHEGSAADQNANQSATASSTLINDQTVANSLDQQRPAYIGPSVQSTCWQNRLDHLPFRTSCDLCIVQTIVCREHHPGSGYCFQHGPPRTYNPGLLYDPGLEDIYNALREESARNMGHSSGVRKRAIKPKPRKIASPRRQEAILRELRSEEDEHGPSTA